MIYNDEMLRSFHQERNRSDYHTLDLNLDDSLQRSLGNMSAMNSEEPEPNLKLFSNSTHVVKYQKGDRQGDSGSTIPEELKLNSPPHKGELYTPNIRSSAKFKPHSNSLFVFLCISRFSMAT